MARENYRVQESRYRAGATTILDVLDGADPAHPVRGGSGAGPIRRAGWRSPASRRSWAADSSRTGTCREIRSRQWRTGWPRPLRAAAWLAVTLAGCSKAESAGKPGGGRKAAGLRRPCPSRWPSRAPIPWSTRSSPPARSRRYSRSSCVRRSRAGSPRSWCARAPTSRQGTPLFKVDDAELKAQVARAEADRDLAQQSLARTQDLLAQKASSQSELERAEATARSNEAQLELLKVRLARTDGARAVRRGGRASAGEPGRLRDHRHPAGLAPDRVAAARRVPGAGALRRPAQGGPAGDLPRRGAPGPGVRRARGLRGPGGATSRTDDHRQGGDAESQAGAAVRHVHRGAARDGGAARAPSSFRRTPSSRSRARPSSGSCVRARRRAARWTSASARRASSRRGAASRPPSRSWSAARSGWRRRAGGSPRSWTGIPFAPRRADRPPTAPPILSGLAASVLLMAGPARRLMLAHRPPAPSAPTTARPPPTPTCSPSSTRSQRAGAGVRIGTLATSVEGRRVPWVLLSRPLVGEPVRGPPRAASRSSGSRPTSTPARSRGRKRRRCCCATSPAGPLRPLLDSLVLIVVPIYNTDGNEHWAPGEENRPGQNGPAIVGRNQNGQGLNLNRDYVKMEAPETAGRRRAARGVGSRRVHRPPHHQRQLSRLRAHLRSGPQPQRQPRARLRARSAAAPRSASACAGGTTRRPSGTATFATRIPIRSRPAGRPTIPARGSAPTGWACEARWRC